MGVGRNVPICLRDDWTQKAVYREHVQHLISSCKTQNEQLSIIVDDAVKYAGNTLHNIECFRWITEVFDKWIDISQSPGGCQVSRTVDPTRVEFLELANNVMIEHHDQPRILQIVGKAVGVMAHNERTRARLPLTQLMPCILHCMTMHQKDAEMIGCLLWALVIMCRPIGGVEGELLSSIEDTHFVNVHTLRNMNGIETVLRTLDTHQSCSEVLSKAFWLSVNLSLADDVKLDLINSGLIAKVLGAMTRFPDERELQYRACFALINLGIKPEAKQQMHQLGGIELVLNAMRTWLGDAALQKCALNVIRSLLVADVVGLAMTFTRLGGIRLLESIQERFSSAQDLMRLTRQTLFVLDNPGQ